MNFNHYGAGFMKLFPYCFCSGGHESLLIFVEILRQRSEFQIVIIYKGDNLIFLIAIFHIGQYSATGIICGSIAVI